MIRPLLVFALATAAVAQPSLLQVRTAAPPGPGGAPALTVSYDLKLTIKVPRIFGGPVVSAGAGLTGTFASQAGPLRRATLLRTAGAPYGIVKYNGDGGHFHVRHLVKDEKNAALEASGQAVIAAWKAHYAESGVKGGDLPAEWGPNVIRNAYAGDPAGRFAFTIRADGGVDATTVADGTREVSEKDPWRTNAWPGLARALGLLSDSPFPGRDPGRLGSGPAFPGADVAGSLRSVMLAAKAVVPQHAGRIPDPAFPALVPTWMVRPEGARIRLTARLPVTTLNRDATLLAYRREVSYDPATRTTVSDAVFVSLDVKGARTEARVSWSH